MVFLTLHLLNAVVLLFGVPKTLLELKHMESRNTMRILATSIGIFYMGYIDILRNFVHQKPRKIQPLHFTYKLDGQQ